MIGFGEFVVQWSVNRLRLKSELRRIKSMPSILEAREVSKVYQMGSTTVAALDHVSVTVEGGEFAAIQGTSGSGKSTLLNVLGGLDHPTDGEILFDAKPLRR